MREWNKAVVKSSWNESIYALHIPCQKTSGMDGRPAWLSKTGKDAIDLIVLKSTVWSFNNVEHQSGILKKRVQRITSNLKYFSCIHPKIKRHHLKLSGLGAFRRLHKQLTCQFRKEKNSKLLNLVRVHKHRFTHWRPISTPGGPCCSAPGQASLTTCFPILT